MRRIPIRKVTRIEDRYEAVWIDEQQQTHTIPLTARQYVALGYPGAGAPPGIPPEIWGLGPSRARAHVVTQYDTGESLQPGDMLDEMTVDGHAGFTVKLPSFLDRSDAIFVARGLGDLVVIDGIGRLSVTPRGGQFPQRSKVARITDGEIWVE